MKKVIFQLFQAQAAESSLWHKLNQGYEIILFPNFIFHLNCIFSMDLLCYQFCVFIGLSQLCILQQMEIYLFE